MPLAFFFFFAFFALFLGFCGRVGRIAAGAAGTRLVCHPTVLWQSPRVRGAALEQQMHCQSLSLGGARRAIDFFGGVVGGVLPGVVLLGTGGETLPDRRGRSRMRGFHSDPLPRSVAAPEPYHAVLARLGTRIWTARVQPPQQRHQAPLGVHATAVRSCHTRCSRRTARAPAL